MGHCKKQNKNGIGGGSLDAQGSLYCGWSLYRGGHYSEIFPCRRLLSAYKSKHPFFCACTWLKSERRVYAIGFMLGFAHQQNFFMRSRRYNFFHGSKKVVVAKR